MSTPTKPQVDDLIQAVLPDFTLLKNTRIHGGRKLSMGRNLAVSHGMYLQVETSFPDAVLSLAVGGNNDARKFIADDVRKSAELAVAR